MAAIKWVFQRLYPQLYGLGLAGITFWFARYFGERVIGETLGLNTLVIPVNLFLLALAFYAGKRALDFTSEQLGQDESPWWFMFFGAPFLIVLAYILLYLPNII